MKKITRQEFEAALKICDAYKKQIEREYLSVRNRIKHHGKISTNLRHQQSLITTIDLNKDSTVSDLKGLDNRVYNALRMSFDKNDKLSILSSYSKDDVMKLRGVGKVAVDNLERYMVIAGLQFKQ